MDQIVPWSGQTFVQIELTTPVRAPRRTTRPPPRGHCVTTRNASCRPPANPNVIELRLNSWERYSRTSPPRLSVSFFPRAACRACPPPPAARCFTISAPFAPSCSYYRQHRFPRNDFSA